MLRRSSLRRSVHLSLRRSFDPSLFAPSAARAKAEAEIWEKKEKKSKAREAKAKAQAEAAERAREWEPDARVYTDLNQPEVENAKAELDAYDVLVEVKSEEVMEEDAIIDVELNMEAHKVAD